MEKTKQRKEIESFMESWAELHHNEYSHVDEVKKDWMDELKEMLDNWS